MERKITFEKLISNIYFLLLRDKMSRNNVLRQVLNYRTFKLAEGKLIYEPCETHAKRYVFSWQRLIEDGHTEGSIHWIKQQSIKIDEIGWDAWLDTKESKNGYSRKKKD